MSVEQQQALQDLDALVGFTTHDRSHRVNPLAARLRAFIESVPDPPVCACGSPTATQHPTGDWQCDWCGRVVVVA